jgi:multidrug efflux pump subunit AcrA (membrane-fusion protein)
MATQVDLRQLAQPRGANVIHRSGAGWRVVTRYLLPLMLLAGFAGALAYSFRDLFSHGKPVRVIPVMAVRTEISESEAPLFRSAGWVEPRPTPVLVTALAEGVVEKLLVIEGQELNTGDEIAHLIDADAKLKVQEAVAEQKSRAAELASSQASLAASEIRLKEPLELQTKLAEAEAMQARVDNELSRIPSQLAAAQARSTLFERELESRKQTTDVISKLALARAESEVQVAAAAQRELLAQQKSLEQELAAQQRRVKSLARQLELKTEEQRQRDEAVAAVRLAEARILQANVLFETANLNLSRMTIKAPTAGKVMALVARPGSKVMGQSSAAGQEASTVVTMYDPAQLQIRADVRLEEVPRVFIGQQARIETPAVKGALMGEVIAATSITDIQKNTLQVKVAVHDPPAVLKPDMLVQVTFLSPASTTPATPQTAAGPLTLVIPHGLVQHDGQAARVWIADREHNVAVLREVTLGGLTPEGLREVKQGLAVGDRIIEQGAEGLRAGERIRIEGEGNAHSAASHPVVNPPDAAPTMTPKMKRL